ncbi:DUF29 domain-containing protein [Pannus brasiliensis CCIBt3594]|uniref:DUF29 domain-containing protein n=1 Tax=Pannus brasiliensis CCIBt3594 TaxID=1427578 RepID=A0AAW9R1Y6_9CHRO
MHLETSISSLYEKDFHAWTREQADLLRERQWNRIDVENLIEEIESLGKQQRQELRNRLGVLLAHLLKWEYQPRKRSRSWLATIRLQRRDILRLLKANPSLNSYIEEALSEAYHDARDLAMGETNLSDRTFPVERPYPWENIIAEDFFPGEPDTLS